MGLPPIDTAPLVFTFSVNTGLQISFELAGGAVTKISHGVRPGQIERKTVTPAAEMWAEFRRTMDAIDVWHLPDSYGLGGSGDMPLWEIRVEYPDRSVHSVGWTGFPVHRGRQTSPVATKRFVRLIRAAMRLFDSPKPTLARPVRPPKDFSLARRVGFGGTSATVLRSNPPTEPDDGSLECELPTRARALDASHFVAFSVQADDPPPEMPEVVEQPDDVITSLGESPERITVTDELSKLDSWKIPSTTIGRDAKERPSTRPTASTNTAFDAQDRTKEAGQPPVPSIGCPRMKSLMRPPVKDSGPIGEDLIPLAFRFFVDDPGREAVWIELAGREVTMTVRQYGSDEPDTITTVRPGLCAFRDFRKVLDKSRVDVWVWNGEHGIPGSDGFYYELEAIYRDKSVSSVGWGGSMAPCPRFTPKGRPNKRFLAVFKAARRLASRDGWRPRRPNDPRLRAAMGITSTNP